eukprot:1110780-Pelagomonas_calceolata.AAC.2
MHDADVLAWGHAIFIEAQPLLDLLLHLLPKCAAGGVQEAVDAGCNRALVGQVARDAALHKQHTQQYLCVNDVDCEV